MGDFFDPANFITLVIPDQTQAAKAVSERLMKLWRWMVEQFMMCSLYAENGTITTGPGVGTEDRFRDSSKSGSWFVDQFNGMSVVITSGHAIGFVYEIDDTLANGTIFCTDDDLYADGVVAGDTFMIFYDLIRSGGLAGHSHDGVNSAVLDVQRPVLLVADIETTSTSTGNLVDGGWFYKLPEYENFYYKYTIGTNSGTVYFRVKVGSIDGSTHSAGGLVSGSANLGISTLATGWYQVRVELWHSTGTDPAELNYFGSYVD